MCIYKFITLEYIIAQVNVRIYFIYCHRTIIVMKFFYFLFFFLLLLLLIRGVVLFILGELTFLKLFSRVTQNQERV